MSQISVIHPFTFILFPFFLIVPLFFPYYFPSISLSRFYFLSSFLYFLLYIIFTCSSFFPCYFPLCIYYFLIFVLIPYPSLYFLPLVKVLFSCYVPSFPSFYLVSLLSLLSASTLILLFYCYSYHLYLCLNSIYGFDTCPSLHHIQ